MLWVSTRKAAFDAVGPLLLIGWAEVGPSLLQAMQATAVSPSSAVLQATYSPYESRIDDQPPVPAPTRQRAAMGAPPAGTAPHRDESGARKQDLLHRARAEDVLHWQQHHRPISAETLRKRLRIGAGTARGLVAQLRSDTRVTLDSRVPRPAAP
jgi:hypothetical protein